MSLSEEIFSKSKSSPASSRHLAVSAREYQDLKNLVHRALAENLGGSLYRRDFGQSRLREEVFEVINKLTSSSSLTISDAERATLIQELVDDILGLGPIESLLRDPDVTEIMVNSPTSVYAERDGLLSKVDVEFRDDEQIRQVIERIVSSVGRRVDESSPMVDARLQDGSRVNAIVPPVAVDGPSFTIRKFSGRIADKNSLVRFGTISTAASEFLECAVAGKQNIIISGGTGSGKTTTLNILAAFIPVGERIVTIEDSAELKLGQEHVVRLESRPSNIEGVGEITIRNLVKNALRMRPDRIVVGEVRDAAALDMLQAMNTGHEGSLSTVHANSNADALSRIETMASMSELDISINIIREQISSAIDILVHQERFRDGSRKITAISEVSGLLDDGSIELKDIFIFDFGNKEDGSGPIGLVPTGNIPACLSELTNRGIEVDLALFGQIT